MFRDTIITNNAFIQLIIHSQTPKTLIFSDWNELSSIAGKWKICRIYWQWILIEKASLYTGIKDFLVQSNEPNRAQKSTVSLVIETYMNGHFLQLCIPSNWDAIIVVCAKGFLLYECGPSMQLHINLCKVSNWRIKHSPRQGFGSATTYYMLEYFGWVIAGKFNARIQSGILACDVDAISSHGNPIICSVFDLFHERIQEWEF